MLLNSARFWFLQERNEKDSKTVILKVYMHCQACAMKTEKAIKGYEGDFTVFF